MKNAGGDPALQISQIQEFIDEQFLALIIDPGRFLASDRYPENCQRAGNTGYFL